MAAPQPPPVWKAREIEFTIDREVWGIYELDSNVELRARTVLLKLQRVRVEGNPEPQYAAATAVLMNINAPPKVRRQPPTQPPNSDQLQGAPKTEIAFRAVDEPWNQYSYEDPDPKVIRTKLVVSGVVKLEGLYDNFGAPMYQVNHATVVAPPSDRKVLVGR